VASKSPDESLLDQCLLGKRALVTGASRGIGSAIAQALARAGAKVALNFSQREHEAAAVQREIISGGGRAILAQADVSIASEVANMLSRVHGELGGVDILVNNAGISRPIPIDRVSEQDWNETVDTNLKSSFLVTQACLPGMRGQGWGRIIFISSVAAQVGGVVGPHYAASKAGQHGLMHYYAAHLAKEGITANVVAPALIRTEMVTENPLAKADLIPVGHFGETEDVASAVLLLAKNPYITGQTINVNGGWYSS
jgi:3-oxoacyl-[acyl-carrier protein] reductase